jgi:phosphoenolpyruvate synthase/pyruvate phosphate dikinase
MFDTDALKAGEVIGEALPASPGAAAGKVVFTAEEAKELGKGGNGERVILVRLETSPEEEDIKALADDMGLTVEEVKAKCEALHEFNPMMGHRGCRLAVTYPEIARMQTRAVMEAAIEVSEEKGYEITPEIMIPLVGEKKELIMT